MFRLIDATPKTIVSTPGFFEDALASESIKYYPGETISTEGTGVKLLNFFPFPDLGIRVDSCTKLTLKEIKVNPKARSAFMSMTMRGKRFCPTAPQVVISKDDDVVVTLSGKEKK
jgi:hypothetical protein